jgi:hypothetical protein
MTIPIQLGLNRPQYVASPETLISALAWRAFPIPLPDEGGRAVGLRFRSEQEKSGTLVYRATAPNRQTMGAFGDALAAAGIAGEASPAQLAEAVEMSVRGLAARGGKSQAVSPLTPALALLQNPRGMMGSKNPPDIAEILEQMYALGSDPDAEASSVTERWLAASRRRLSRDPLLGAIDEATQRILLPNAGVGDLSGAPVGAHFQSTKTLPLLGASTPFSWFRKSWDRLTSPEWVDALPPRVWVDWATTVLRLAYGLGYVWETNRLDHLSRAIISEQATPEWQLGGRASLIPWRSSRLSVSDRNVAPMLIAQAHRVDRVRQFLNSLEPDNADDIEYLVGSASVRTEIQRILTTKDQTRSGKNLWEASRYALMTRSIGGESADYYGFLRAHGNRYLVPEPGTEWIAVIASLACIRPNSSTTVHRVLSDLDSLGIRPELGDLIGLLERSGLARGSADADQALVVQSAY